MKPRRIIIHCSDTLNGLTVPAETIKGWHLKRGFTDIGYHEVIQPLGDLEYGRPTNVVGAHCEGENHDSLAICMIGKNAFTRKAWDQLRRRLDALLMVHSIEPWRIYTHAQFPSAIKQGKTCPNMSVNELLGWYILNDESVIKRYIYDGVIS